MNLLYRFHLCIFLYLSTVCWSSLAAHCVKISSLGRKDIPFIHHSISWFHHQPWQSLLSLVYILFQTKIFYFSTWWLALGAVGTVRALGEVGAVRALRALGVVITLGQWELSWL